MVKTNNKKKRGSSFLETVTAAFDPLSRNKDVLKEQAAAPNRAEIDRNTRLMNTPAPDSAEQPEQRKPNFTEPEIIRNADTGEPTFVKMPDGRVVSVAGEKPQQVQDLVDSGNKKIATPKGAVEATDAQAIRENQQQAQEAVQQVGQLPQNLNPALVDFGDRTATDLALNTQGLLSAGGGALAGALGAKAIGGAVGGAAGGPVGVAVGAAIGTASFILGRISLARRNVVKRAYNSFTESKKSNTYMLNLANSGKVPSTELVEAYNRNLAVIYAARAELREQVKTKVGQSLSGAQEELADIEVYLADEAFRQAIFKQALLTPNPNVVFPTEFDATPQE